MSETTTDIDANGYNLVAGYRVKDTNNNGRPGLEIVVSPSKRVVIQSLKMSEQLDLFEILSASDNPTYRSLATLAASVRALGPQPIPAPPAPKFFPKSPADLRALLGELDEEGTLAILAVQSEKSSAGAGVEANAKN